MNAQKPDSFEETRHHFEQTQKIYEKMSNLFLYMHNIAQLIIFFGATFTAIIVNFPTISKIIPTVVSGVVAFVTALESYYKFKDLSDHHKYSARALEKERHFYSTHTGPYSDLGEEEARNAFMEQCEKIKDEQTQFSPGR